MGEVENVLVKTNTGFLTWPDIEHACQSFELTLKNPETLSDGKSLIFNQLLRYIRQTILSEVPLKAVYKSNPDNDMYYDYDILDSIFNNIYLPLCYTYNRVPSITNYCIHLINIDISGIYNIRTGLNYNNNSNNNKDSKLQQYILKWENACNSDLIDYIVQTSSIGGIFRAKTKGFREEQVLHIETSAATPTVNTIQLQTLIQSDNVPLLPTENA